MLVGGESLVEEQTSLALHYRASERDRLARCAGLLVRGSVAGVEMQRVHRLGDIIKPAVADDVSLVVVRKDGVRGIGGLTIAVVRVILLVVGCDVLPAIDWAVIVMKVVHNRCLAINPSKLLHCRHLLHEAVLVDCWRLMSGIHLVD